MLTTIVLAFIVTLVRRAFIPGDDSPARERRIVTREGVFPAKESLL